MTPSQGQRADIEWAQEVILAPVLGRLSSTSELETLTLAWSDNNETLWARIVACGEAFCLSMCDDYPPGEWHRGKVNDSDREVPARVASLLQDEIAHSRFAWGQMRAYEEWNP